MRSIIFILALALITSCRTHKELQQDKSVAVDSVARSEHHRTIAVIDSAIRNIDFSFDTLKINIERPYSVGDSVASQPEVIRIKAVRGRVIDRRRAVRDSVEAFNRLDTVAYHQSAAETSTEHTATTRLYNPPDGTAVMIIALIIAGILFFVCYRKR
ncbi:MAG: hypothetical protein SPC80_01590 [Prevotella sp.]|jgi:hypothetical protein|nr:hypothetical protein [Prevotella sp.]